ncbi:hypothetical protein QYE76_004187 [Lolium multiflorum]|uniref:Retrotransposon gag domain-containing protein n=1 Tax=Lolium multiflorum TaxID=4521 RepID=A0AAD8RS29_LOLMU|nr:hypothetical protein QYE76_004187 [Lolium multiflorum]
MHPEQQQQCIQSEHFVEHVVLARGGRGRGGEEEGGSSPTTTTVVEELTDDDGKGGGRGGSSTLTRRRPLLAVAAACAAGMKRRQASHEEEEQLDVKMDVKLDMELDMKISHGRAREEREACARGDEEPAGARDHKIVNQENKDSADIINWREFEALRNEMRREFRVRMMSLRVQLTRSNMILAIENLTAQQQQQEDDEDPKLEDDAHNARGAPRGHRPRGWVPLGRNGRGQDEEDGLGKPKFSIPKFEGGADVEEYLTWELKIEKLWSLHPNYSEDKKIKLASSEFDGYALRWWDSLVRNRDEDGAQPIRTWRAMKEVMTSRFVPTNYMRNIFDKLTLLRQGVKTVDEYYMEMEMLMQRGRVRESLEMTMQRFLNGLNWLKKQRLRDVLRELGVYTPRALYSAGAFDALRSLLYSA